MKCECISEIPKKMIRQGNWKGKKLTDATLQETALLFLPGRIESVTYSTFKCDVEGYKQPVEIKFQHTYCPFCGTKINDEEQPSQPGQTEPGG